MAKGKRRSQPIGNLYEEELTAEDKIVIQLFAAGYIKDAASVINDIKQLFEQKEDVLYKRIGVARAEITAMFTNLLELFLNPHATEQYWMGLNEKEERLAAGQVEVGHYIISLRLDAIEASIKKVLFYGNAVQAHNYILFIDCMLDEMAAICNRHDHTLKWHPQYYLLEDWLVMVKNSFSVDLLASRQQLLCLGSSISLPALSPIAVPASASVTTMDMSAEIARKVEKHLQFMAGKNPRNHRLILKEDDYNRLLDYTLSFVQSLQVPAGVRTVEINLNKGDILYCYGQLYKAMYPGSPYPFFLLQFLHRVFKVFGELTCSEESFQKDKSYKKLGTRPQYYPGL